MKMGGDISIGGVTLFCMISKRKKEIDHKHEDRGSIPKGIHPLSLMSKGDRNIGRIKR
jgi:hypothetical protein